MNFVIQFLRKIYYELNCTKIHFYNYIERNFVSFEMVDFKFSSVENFERNHIKDFASPIIFNTE